jgi:hypothetical protein
MMHMIAQMTDEEIKAVSYRIDDEISYKRQ